MTDWARLSVSHCQYDVFTVAGASGVGIYTIGDDLLHVGGPNQSNARNLWMSVGRRTLPATLHVQGIE